MSLPLEESRRKRNVEWVFFQGKGSWFNKLLKGDQEYQNWNIKLSFNPESYNKFLKLQEADGETQGIMNEVKRDEDGYFHNFKRPFVKDFGRGEEHLPAPLILDNQGQPWDNRVQIGNGSDITVKCEVYTFTNRRTKKKGKAIRMVGITIDNLVPYTSKDFTPEEEHAVRGLDEQPKQLF